MTRNLDSRRAPALALLRHAARRLPRVLPALAVALAAAAALAAPARAVRAQAVAGGDFDVCDNSGGTTRGKTAFLRGRQGFGTERGIFVLVNAASSDQDCARDGYTPGIDFLNLIVSDTTDFRNIANPSAVILRTNLVIADFLNPLRNGLANAVSSSRPARQPVRTAGRSPSVTR